MTINKSFLAAAMLIAAPVLAQGQSITYLTKVPKNSKIKSSFQVTVIVDPNNSNEYQGWQIARNENVTGKVNMSLQKTVYCSIVTGGVAVERSLGLVNNLSCGDGSAPVSSPAGFPDFAGYVCSTSKTYNGTYTSPSNAPGTETVTEGCNGPGMTPYKSTSLKWNQGIDEVEEILATVPGLPTTVGLFYSSARGTAPTLPTTLYNPAMVKLPLTPAPR